MTGEGGNPQIAAIKFDGESLRGGGDEDLLTKRNLLDQSESLFLSDYYNYTG